MFCGDINIVHKEIDIKKLEIKSKKLWMLCQRKEHGWIKFLKNTHALMRLEKLIKIQKNTLGGQTEAMPITTMLDGGLIIKSIIIIFQGTD